ncbi:hypothetical protein D3C85_89970 [compost metagenome]
MGTARRILIIGGCALGLARLLVDHGIDVVTEEEYREGQNVPRQYVGIGPIGLFTHLDYGAIVPSLTAGMVLDYDPVVEVERRWHAFHRPELLRSNLEEFPLPHVRGTCLGIEDF